MTKTIVDNRSGNPIKVGTLTIVEGINYVDNLDQEAKKILASYDCIFPDKVEAERTEEQLKQDVKNKDLEIARLKAELAGLQSKFKKK